jgi:GNAT superfamily N-acetyltransferase
MSILIRNITGGDCEPIEAAFARIGWTKPASLFRRYLTEQGTGSRIVLLAVAGNVFAGYVTVLWQSYYPPFKEGGIPEISDFNVLLHLRRQGTGSRLLDEAEGEISKRSPVAGIGVGLTADYGPAQALYVRRGYVPDARGIVQRGRRPVYGDTLTVDDDLCLYFTKVLAKGAG